jgi:hypothetical protein
MYTVEFGSACATITTLDEHDAYDDVEVIICEDDTVFIKQHIQDVEEVNVIYMSYGQLLDILAGLSSTAGAYRLQQEDT